MKLFFKIFLLIFFASWIFFFAPAQATSLGHISDLLSNSAPGIGVNHTIKFFNPSFIPAGGRIVITPQDGKFSVPNDFDYTDVDLAVSDSGSENFIDRDLTAAADNAADGVSVTAGAGGSITITLNSSAGINAGQNVRVELGTNAENGATGDKQITNPSETGSYDMTIATYNDSGGLLDRSIIKVALVENVEMNTFIEKIRSNGKPTMADVLTPGTTMTLMSMMTNYRAYCRYKQASGPTDTTASTTPFNQMTDQFPNTGDYYHSVILTGLTPGDHIYYVRCIDRFAVADADGYLIEFHISSGGEGNTGTGSGIGEGGTGTGAGEGDSEGGAGRPRGGGGGGSGGFSGSGAGSGGEDLKPYPPPLSAPDVTLKGWAYSSAKLMVLKDGKEEKSISTNAKGEFSVDFFALTKGVYTFGIWAQDSDGRKSNVYSSTFWVNEGTKTQISEIFIPPTLAAKKLSVSKGETVEFVGQSTPGSVVEISLFPWTDKEPPLDKIKITEGMADDKGKWQATLGTKGLAEGQYKARARARIPSVVGFSNYDKPLQIGIGVSVANNSTRADFNNDGKVNLIDFSILLFNWGKSNAQADINGDGKVNLVDFSMMMYQWTG